MWVARDAARRVRAELGVVGPITGAEVCWRLGLTLAYHPLPGAVRGLYAYGYVTVRPDLWAREAEHVIAHEVGHHCLHGPYGGMDFWQGRDPVMLRKIERRAEEFAYFFTLPGDELLPLLRDGVPLAEIAERYGRWPGWVWHRACLAWRAGELDPLRRQEQIA